MIWQDRGPGWGGSGTMKKERIPWTQTQVPPPGTAERPGTGRRAATDGPGQGEGVSAGLSPMSRCLCAGQRA